MNNLLFSCASISLAILIGSIVFQSFIVAPAVFQQLDQGAARSFLRALFPRFFRMNAAAGLVATAALLATGVAGGWSDTLAWTTLGAAATAGCMLASLALVPAINAARDQGEAAAGRFAALHKMTVILTVVALVLAIGIVGVIGSGA